MTQCGLTEDGWCVLPFGHGVMGTPHQIDPDVDADEATAKDCAGHLIRIARDLRLAGDVPLVLFTEEGIEPQALTLAGELELIALRLDYEGVTAMAADYDPDRKPQ